MFTAIFEYQTHGFDGSEQVMDPQIQIVFEFFKNQFELENLKSGIKIHPLSVASLGQSISGKNGGKNVRERENSSMI